MVASMDEQWVAARVVLTDANEVATMVASMAVT